VSLRDRLWHKRHRDWEAFDRIEFDIVDRYKTSGLSGDEWRHHVRMRFYFKGEVVHEDGARDMQSAMLRVGSIMLEKTCPIPDRVIELEKTKCSQPGCKEDAVGRFRIKKEFGHQGEDLAPPYEGSPRYSRQFCKRHLRRGDRSREDCDANYEPLDGIGPDGSTNLVESPSAQVVMSLEEFEAFTGVEVKP
jgi:hypothetical protein